MKIGIASPVSLQLLSSYVENGESLPKGYSFPPMAIFIEALLKRGHQVSVFTLDQTTEKLRIFRGKEVRIHIGRYRPRARSRTNDLFAEEIKQLVIAMQNDACEAIHAHWTYEFALAAIASGFPYLVTAHDAPWQVLRYMPNIYRFMRLLMAIKVAQKTTCLTAVSPYIAKHFKNFLFYNKPIRVIPNGIPDHIFSIKKRSIEESGTINFATILIGWNRLKNAQMALKAFDKVRRRIPKVRLYMYGAGYGKGEDAMTWAQTHNLAEGVKFVGALHHSFLLKELAERIDILVHPSLIEAHPVTVIEAMALGIPVIGGNHSGGVPFTLNYGAAGILVDVRSEAVLVDAMCLLAGNRANRLALGQKGKEFARSEFRLEKVIDSYEQIYSEIHRN